MLSYLVLLPTLLFTNGESRMLRQNIGIQQIAASPSTSGGLTPPAIPLPVGNTSPTPATSPSPFFTYKPTISGNPVQMNWTPDPNALAFDISNIVALKANNMGSNFRVLITARPVFPVPTVSLR